jgi:predicted ATPase
VPVTELHVEGYRSIPEMNLSLKRLNVIVGPNGCGKSNLYQSIGLLRAAAEGALARTLAGEGGMPSALWAGARKAGPVRMKLGVTLDEFRYELELGLPQISGGLSRFVLDPMVKSETLIEFRGTQRIKLLERGKSGCTIRNANGEQVSYLMELHHAESVMDQIVDPHQFPHLDDLRRRLLKWRFYHGFRTDSESPMRRPQVGVRTRVLSTDGSDLAAALQTIIENGDDLSLRSAVSDAFPGAQLVIQSPSEGVFEVAMGYPGIARPLVARELSDGTLRYLCLLAALLSPSPAPLLALNEPETSLHEDLLPPLARLIAQAAAVSQVWLTTHSHILAQTVCEETGVVPIKLDKVDGATQRAGRPKGLAYSQEWDG